MAPISREALWEEWVGLDRWWDAIYRWRRCTGVAYAEDIASWIIDAIRDTRLNATGLREKTFWVGHHGQVQLNDSNCETEEKLLCRAAFNQRYIEGLGVAVDYELPLNKTRKARHGDIDLLCLRENELLCIEAKTFRSSESVLKGLLEAFVYTRLLNARKEQLLKDFCLDLRGISLRPVFLTFSDATSCRQLANLPEDSSIPRLIRELDRVLAREKIEPIELRCGHAGGVCEGKKWRRLPFHGDYKLICFKPCVTLTTTLLSLE